MTINRNMFGDRVFSYEIIKTKNRGVKVTTKIIVYGVGRVRAALALFFAVLGCYGIVETILK